MSKIHIIYVLVSDTVYVLVYVYDIEQCTCTCNLLCDIIHGDVLQWYIVFFLKLTVLSLVLLNNNCFFGRNVQYLRYYIQSHVHVQVDTCTCVR